MSASPVKISVLALTAEAAGALPGWRYMPTGVRFVATPCPGVTVTLRPLWTFKGWYAITQPSVAFESAAVTKAFASALGRRPDNPLIRFRYQVVYRNTGRVTYRPTFWEDLPERRNPDERLVDDVPAYIAELVEDYTRHMAPHFDFTDERAFLRSLPETYTYHGDLVQDDLCYLVVRCMLGDPGAIDRFVADTAVPQGMRDRIAGDIARLREHAESLRLI